MEPIQTPCSPILLSHLIEDRPRSLDASVSYLVNRSGVKIRRSTPLMDSVYLKRGFEPWTPDVVNVSAPLCNTVLVHRYKGGLGDMITMRPGIENLSLTDWRFIHLAIPKQYFWIFKDIYKVVLIEHDSLFNEKVVDYKTVREQYSLAIDMFCPAGVHEAATQHRPVKGRIHIFCDYLENPPHKPQAPSLNMVSIPLFKFPRPLVAFQISSERKEKDWPLTKYTELGLRLLKQGISCVSIHPTDPLPKIPSLTGLSQEQIAYFFQNYVDIVVGPDSGLLHLASMLDIPTIWLFGPTDPKTTLEFYPLADFIHMTEDNSCHRPCYYNSEFNGFRCLDRHGDCMQEIQVTKVENKILERLNA